MYRIHVHAVMSAGLIAVAGCSGGPGVDDAVTVTFSSKMDIAKEHCRVNTSLSTRWTDGNQVLIYRGSLLRGACTVKDDNKIAAGTIEMSPEMMKDRVWLPTDGMDPVAGIPHETRIAGVTVRFDAPKEPAAPRITAPVETVPRLEDECDDTMEEFISPPNDMPTSTAGITVGYTAPHPSENPVSNEDPALKDHPELDDMGRSYLGWKAAWGKRDMAHDTFWTLGWRGNRGHCPDHVKDTVPMTTSNTDRFHITATEMSFASYPGLAMLADAKLDYAVALHGQGPKETATCNTNIMVGGRIGLGPLGDLGFRRSIAENVRMLVPPEITPGDGKLVPDHVKYSTAGNLLDGCSFFQGEEEHNYVNAIAASGGLQLEQGSALDAATYQAVGEAVHQVFDCLNAPGINAGTFPGPDFPQQKSSGSSYATGTCNGFVVDVKLTATSGDFSGGLQTANCQVGAHVHLDVYHRNTAGSWDRIAGGTRTHTGCNPEVFTDAAYDDAGAATPPSFQQVLNGSPPTGDFRLVIRGYTGAYFTPATALPVFGQGGS